MVHVVADDPAHRKGLQGRDFLGAAAADFLYRGFAPMAAWG